MTFRLLSATTLAGISLLPLTSTAIAGDLKPIGGTLGQPITIAVKEVSNDAGTVWWWRPAVGRSLTDMLSSELKETGHFTVLEREKLDKVLDEQRLASTGAVKKNTAPKKGMVTGAKYYILASIADYQENVESKGGGGGFSLFGFGQQERTQEQKAYVAVDVKVVDTTTGEVAYSRSIEGTATSTDTQKSTSGGFGGIQVNQEEQSSSKPPASKAVRAAFIEASEYLDCMLYKKDSCIQEYAAKDKARKEKTKDTLTF